MTTNRLSQEEFRPLRIDIPQFDDPKVTEWARNLEFQINNILIGILQRNQDRFLSAVLHGTSGIYSYGITLQEISYASSTPSASPWTITPSGTSLFFKYGDQMVNKLDA